MSSEAIGVGIAGSARFVPAAGEALLRTAARSGLHAWARLTELGEGRVLLQAGIGPRKLSVLPDPPDYVVALDSVDSGLAGRAARAAVVDHFRGEETESEAPGGEGRRLNLPMAEISPDPEHRIAAAVGALTKMLDLDSEDYLRRWEWPAEDAVRNAIERAESMFPELSGVPRAGSPGGPLVVFGGGEAAAAGAAAAGCRFWATGRGEGGAFDWASSRGGALGMVCVRAGDAGAAAQMALGAGHAGVRAMAEVPAGSSVSACEALDWAARAEVPCVVLHTGVREGEFFHILADDPKVSPRAVIASSSLDELYHDVEAAFGWAERFQCPVSVLVDARLLRRWETVGTRHPAERAGRGIWAAPDLDGFDRYAAVSDGISPRAVPGQSGLAHVAAPDDGSERALKLERKCAAIAAGLGEAAALDGPELADLTLIAQGGMRSALGWILENVNEGSKKINLLTLRRLLPFPVERLRKALRLAPRCMVVESLDDGPLRRIIRQETGADLRVLRMEVPMDARRAFDAVKTELYGG